ncbi:MAG: hypothetical protein IT445_14795 [Phycisphaeraceae bacterium]|nr:hypothetical protein [Phycisphaeraceae bacterium]
MSNAIGSSVPVIQSQDSQAIVFKPAKWFYCGTAVLLLVLALWGFSPFYLHGRAYPGGRPIDPRIFAVVVVHGVVMTAWLILLVVQPMLVALNKRRLHMTIGRFAAGLALLTLIFGNMIAIGSARTTPPEAMIWGMTPRQFMAVPFIAVWTFALFVALGVYYRRRPDIHRPMMLVATLTVMSAAISRIDPLNHLYLGTIWERWFGPFFITIVLSVLLLVLRCLLVRRFERWLALGVAAMIALNLFTLNIATTAAWDRFASLLVG